MCSVGVIAVWRMRNQVEGAGYCQERMTGVQLLINAWVMIFSCWRAFGLQKVPAVVYEELLPSNRFVALINVQGLFSLNLPPLVFQQQQ